MQNTLQCVIKRKAKEQRNDMTQTMFPFYGVGFRTPRRQRPFGNVFVLVYNSGIVEWTSFFFSENQHTRENNYQHTIHTTQLITYMGTIRLNRQTCYGPAPSLRHAVVAGLENAEAALVPHLQ